MNIIKLQQDLIKTTKPDTYFIQINGGEVIVATAYQVWCMDSDDFLLDVEKLRAKKFKTDVTVFTKILAGAANAKPAVKTGNLRAAPDKRTLVELKCGDELIYIDTKLLSLYDKSAELRGTNGKSPVYIYENDILVGLVMPVRGEVR